MNPGDIIDWIRAELASQPAALEAVEPVLRRARLDMQRTDHTLIGPGDLR